MFKKTFLAGLWITITLLSFTTVYAGYDKTNWGMSIAKVKTMYPDGIIQKKQNGDTTYSLVQPIAGFTTAYLIFIFRPKKGLQDVSILFPEQGTPVDLKNGRFTSMVNNECISTFKSLSENLIMKYGTPTSVKDEQKNWGTKDDDLVSLTNMPGQTGHCTVGIGYSKIENLKSELTNGL